MVVPHVVERQDHAAGIAEDDVHALADERLAQRRPHRCACGPAGPGVGEHRDAGTLDLGGGLRASAGDVAADGRRSLAGGRGGAGPGSVTSPGRRVSVSLSPGTARWSSVVVPSCRVAGCRWSVVCGWRSVGPDKTKDPRLPARVLVDRGPGPLSRCPYLGRPPVSRREPVRMPISSSTTSSSLARRDTSASSGSCMGTRRPSARIATATRRRCRCC